MSTLSRGDFSQRRPSDLSRSCRADDHAWDSAHLPKKCLLSGRRKLRNIVASKLVLNWSPEEISGWLKDRVSRLTRACGRPTNRFTVAFSLKRGEN